MSRIPLGQPIPDAPSTYGPEDDPPECEECGEFIDPAEGCECGLHQPYEPDYEECDDFESV